MDWAHLITSTVKKQCCVILIKSMGLLVRQIAVHAFQSVFCSYFNQLLSWYGSFEQAYHNALSYALLRKISILFLQFQFWISVNLNITPTLTSFPEYLQYLPFTVPKHLHFSFLLKIIFLSTVFFYNLQICFENWGNFVLRKFKVVWCTLHQHYSKETILIKV